jgi:hypothetical protein
VAPVSDDYAPADSNFNGRIDWIQIDHVMSQDICRRFPEPQRCPGTHDARGTL